MSEHEHDRYTVVRVEGDKKYRSCGCVEIGHQVTMENMCQYAREWAEGVMSYLKNTPDGQARVKEVYEKSRANGGTFVE